MALKEDLEKLMNCESPRDKAKAPTNPNPEGLPSLKLPGGWHIQDTKIYNPEGKAWGYYRGFENDEEIQSFATAMNAHTDALGAALESIANNTCCEGCQEAKKVARAVLEAWRSGR